MGRFAAFLCHLWQWMKSLLVLDYWLNKRSILKTSFLSLGNCDEHFSFSFVFRQHNNVVIIITIIIIIIIISRFIDNQDNSCCQAIMPNFFPYSKDRKNHDRKQNIFTNMKHRPSKQSRHLVTVGPLSISLTGVVSWFSPLWNHC